MRGTRGFAKITRAFHFGEPSAGFLKRYENNVSIENSVIAATKIDEDNFKPVQVAMDMYEKLGYKDMWNCTIGIE
ncbi:MAG: hypothetical protein LBU64_13520 [Planctomycetota bacterium]|jgi:hypothetical protein|nr:hypothetical protein [Planctomycetota bacterium]